MPDAQLGLPTGRVPDARLGLPTGRVLVHCAMGVSRSATVVLALPSPHAVSEKGSQRAQWTGDMQI